MLSRRVKKADLVNSTQSSSTPSQNARSLGMAGMVCPAVEQRPVYFNEGREFCCRHLLPWLWKKKDNRVHIAYYRFNSFSICRRLLSCLTTSQNWEFLVVSELNKIFLWGTWWNKLLANKHFRTCWKSYLPIWEVMPLFSWKIQNKALYLGGRVLQSS